ncbi:single hybrid motif-containing protein [Schizophyllum fasciatum]
MSSLRLSASARAATNVLAVRRMLHHSAVRAAISDFRMPAMSPTMTEGGVHSWKVKEGDSFAAGDVLLEIETDKATIDVEAQEDGVMGKIIVDDGTKNIPVGKVIALLAEEGDDISNLEPPKEDDAPAPKDEPSAKSSAASSAPPATASPSQSAPAEPKSAAHDFHPPAHERPLFPSVHRLLAEHNITDLSRISGSGVRGMITKGDILTFLGLASGPLGTFTPPESPIPQKVAARGKEVRQKALDGPELRRLIVSTMLQSSIKARQAAVPTPVADFDSVIADYLPSRSANSPAAPVPPPTKVKKADDFLDGLI